MKKKILLVSAFAMTGLMMSSCGGGTKTSYTFTVSGEKTETKVNVNDSLSYTLVNYPQVDNWDSAPKDKDGYVSLFDGATFTGWRGYLKDKVPGRWIIEDGAIRLNGSGGGEAQEQDGGDIIFAKKFKNFELSIDWKVARGSNSGIFYLGQEVKGQPLYVSAPESQVLDNDNHPDAQLGVDGNRKSSSLYDMIPANPQNAKPAGEWNNTTITVYKGTVIHKQNGKVVLEYHLWTPQWTELLQKSKFSQDKWPIAFALLNNVGGNAREGYIGLQDHGDDVWFRNIKVKITD
ncbi:MAG: glycosyl hydrolase [Bacteroidales bacterium]